MISPSIGQWSLLYVIAVIQKYGLDFNLSSFGRECFRGLIYESILSLC
jgi:hypothetical protein